MPINPSACSSPCCSIKLMPRENCRFNPSALKGQWMNTAWLHLLPVVHHAIHWPVEAVQDWLQQASNKKHQWTRWMKMDGPVKSFICCFQSFHKSRWAGDSHRGCFRLKAVTYTSDRYKQKQNTHKETSTPPYSHWLQLVSDPGAARQNNKLLYCHKWDGRIRISLFFSNFFPCFSTPQKIYQNFDQEDTCLAIMCLDGCHYPFSLRSLSTAKSRCDDLCTMYKCICKK